MNKLDNDYLALCKDILDSGVKKVDRTGTGTKSVFGRQIRHKMCDGFPALTTKRLAFKQVVTELLWFLQGRTDLKYLLDNNCNIWVGDAYKKYCQTEILSSSARWSKIIYDDSGNPHPELYTEVEFIEKIKNDPQFEKEFGDLGPIYGKQWRDWGGRKTDGFIEFESNGYSEHIKGIDQIANLINDLKTNPDSRRLMVLAWNVEELYQMTLPPCHYGFQVWTKELSLKERKDYWFKNNKPNRDVCDSIDESSEEEQYRYLDKSRVPKRAISLMFNMRSNDVPLGFPFNIASYGLLLEIICKMVNMVPDELIANLGDTHIYNNQVDGILEQMSREPLPLPKLSINTEFWPTESGECGVGPLSSNIDNLIRNMNIDDFQLVGYKSHPAIKMPLSN